MEFAVAKLCRYLVLLRRQSDIIGQTACNEYRLLLQRPAHADEPAEVADYLIAGLIIYIVKFNQHPSEVSLSARLDAFVA